MLILLPPSEGKTAPRSGAPLDLDALALADDAADREAWSSASKSTPVNTR